MDNTSELLDFAKTLAKQGGKLAKSFLGKTRTEIKSDDSPVTQADFAVQDKIISAIIEKFPRHGIIAEEADDRKNDTNNKSTEFTWIIDPIDGTRNFARGIPVFCCSVALFRKGQPLIAAIYDPNFDWLFTATRNHKSELNGQAISVNNESFSNKTVLAYSVDTCKPFPIKLNNMFNECVLRNFGSAALHLAMTAAGMIDGVMNFSGKLWDIAAGMLIVEQASGNVNGLDNTSKPIFPIDIENYNNEPIPLCAGNVKIVNFIREYK